MQTALILANIGKYIDLQAEEVAFFVSLLLRSVGGEPLFGIPPLVQLPDWWPTRTFAALAGIILLPLVSRIVKQKK
jgi:hypothetical protein